MLNHLGVGLSRTALMSRAIVGFTASLTSCDGISHENGMISKASPGGVEAVIQTAPITGML